MVEAENISSLSKENAVEKKDLKIKLNVSPASNILDLIDIVLLCSYVLKFIVEMQSQWKGLSMHSKQKYTEAR